MFDPILVGMGDLTTHFRLPILVVGLTGGRIYRF